MWIFPVWIFPMWILPGIVLSRVGLLVLWGPVVITGTVWVVLIWRVIGLTTIGGTVPWAIAAGRRVVERGWGAVVRWLFGPRRRWCRRRCLWRLFGGSFAVAVVAAPGLLVAAPLVPTACFWQPLSAPARRIGGRAVVVVSVIHGGGVVCESCE